VQRTLESTIWRWAALAVVLASAYLVARSGRYTTINDCVGAGGRIACFVFDRWAGDFEVRALTDDEIRQSIGTAVDSLP